MRSYRVSCMLLFLLPLLVFPHIDKVLGAQMELRKLEETKHDDQVTVQGIPGGGAERLRPIIDRFRRFLDKHSPKHTSPEYHSPPPARFSGSAH